MMNEKRTFLMQMLVAALALGVALAMGLSYQRIIKNPIEIESEKEKQFEPLKVILDPYTFSRIDDLCENGVAKIQESEAVVNFTEPKPEEGRSTVCPWGLGDNIAPRPGKMASRYEQTTVATLPPKAVLCDLKVEVEKSPFFRQDFFFLTLNSRVLATDAEFLFQYLQEESVNLSGSQKISAYTYDWARMLGMRMPKNQSEATRRDYCIGRDINFANCSFGNGEEPTLEIEPKLARWLGSKGMTSNLRFSLITTGDSDIKKDCTHTPLKMKLKMKYVLAD